MSRYEVTLSGTVQARFVVEADDEFAAITAATDLADCEADTSLAEWEVEAVQEMES